MANATMMKIIRAMIFRSEAAYSNQPNHFVERRKRPPQNKRKMVSDFSLACIWFEWRRILTPDCLVDFALCPVVDNDGEESRFRCYDSGPPYVESEQFDLNLGGKSYPTIQQNQPQMPTQGLLSESVCGFDSYQLGCGGGIFLPTKRSA